MYSPRAALNLGGSSSQATAEIQLPAAAGKALPKDPKELMRLLQLRSKATSSYDPMKARIDR